MGSVALVRRSKKHAINSEELRSAIVRLGALAAHPASPSVPELPACISILEEALSNMREASGILQTVAANADALVTAPETAQAANCPVISVAPVCEEALHAELAAIQELLTNTVESCLHVRRVLCGEEVPVDFHNMRDDSRDGAPL